MMFSASLPCGSWDRACIRSFRRSELHLDLVEQFLDLAAFKPGDVVLVLEQYAERVGYGRRIERHRVEFGERSRPIERLGNARRLEQILLAQRLHEPNYLLGKFLADAGDLGA